MQFKLKTSKKPTFEKGSAETAGVRAGKSEISLVARFLNTLRKQEPECN